MKNQTYRMTMLYDFYGELLTERQKEFFDLYYNEDLSLAEIAENAGISRQGVRDVIVRAEGIMQEVEDKTGLIRRFEALRPHLDAIQSAAEEIQTINYRLYEDAHLGELAQRIQTEAAALAEALGENANLSVRSIDLPLLKGVKLPAGTTLTADDSIELGGLKGANAAKGLAADDTLAARLNAQHEWFLENAGLEINI